MKKIDKEILEWHKKTFPDAKIEKQLMKLEEEYTELCKSFGGDIMEAADVYIVASVLKYRFNSKIGGCFLGLIDESWKYMEIMKAIKEKMEINKKRKWTFKKGVYRHKEQ